MNRDDIIRMAREAELIRDDSTASRWLPGTDLYPELNVFAALVATAEREAILDEWADRVQSDLEHGVRYLNERAAKEWKEKYLGMAGFADAIYARGDT